MILSIWKYHIGLAANTMGSDQIPVNRMKCTICGKQAKARLRDDEPLCLTHYANEKNKRARAATINLIRAVEKRRVLDPEISKIIKELRTYYEGVDQKKEIVVVRRTAEKADGNIEKRINSVESRLDKLINLLENTTSNRNR